MKKLIIPIILLSSFSGTSDYNSPFQAKLSVENDTAEIGLFSKQQYEVLITFSETKQAAVISESGYYLTFNDNDLKQNGGEIIVKIITDEKMVYQMSLLKDVNHLSLDQYNNTFYLDYYLIGKNIDIIENNKLQAIHVINDNFSVDKFIDLSTLDIVYLEGVDNLNLYGYFFVYSEKEIFQLIGYDYLRFGYEFPLQAIQLDNRLLLQFKEEFYYQIGTMQMCTDNYENIVSSRNLYFPNNYEETFLDAKIVLMNNNCSFQINVSFEFTHSLLKTEITAWFDEIIYQKKVTIL